ncbi:reverse transcriptase domain, reverse transcriptase zinc-binding domain protein, partial [Tanacetum coccineum]
MTRSGTDLKMAKLLASAALCQKWGCYTTPVKINDYRPISYCNVLFKCINSILLTQELMRNYHRKRGPLRCAFKVDIQKAYDTVDWGFLRSILVGFGFHPTMRKVQNAEDFQYHHLCEQQRIVNLCFADDLFLFARGHPNSVRTIIDALEEFKNVSGLVPSIPKSTAFFCNVLNALKANILSSMPFAEGTLPVKYLGVPFISSRLLYCDCKVLVEKLESRLVRGFLWCQGEMKKGMAKVAWDTVCLPHHEGRLGIHKLDDFNVALMATHVWCILINKESLWVQCIHSYKLKVRNIVCSGFSLSNTISDLVSNGAWRWPHDWSSRFPNIVNIHVPNINNELDDVIVWRNVQGVWFPHCIPSHALHMWLVIKEKLKTQDRLRQWDVRAFTGMSSVPPRLVDVLVFLIPSKGSSISNVISQIVLATMTYCLWNEWNSRLFKKKKSTADQIVQLITSLVRMKLVTFKFKKMFIGSRLMLDQWNIPSSCFDHDKSLRVVLSRNLVENSLTETVGAVTKTMPTQTPQCQPKKKKAKKDVFTVYFNYDGIFTSFPLKYSQGHMKELNDTNFDEMSYEHLKEIALRNEIDMYVEHFGHDIMELAELERNEEQNHNSIESSDDEYYGSDDCEEIENLCSARIMFRGTAKHHETETPLVDPDENQIDYVNKVQSGVLYPAFDSDIPWDKMEPTLGMRYETPHQLKLALANYGVAHGYQLWYMKNDWREVLVYCGRNVEDVQTNDSENNTKKAGPSLHGLAARVRNIDGKVLMNDGKLIDGKDAGEVRKLVRGAPITDAAAIKLLKSILKKVNTELTGAISSKANTAIDEHSAPNSTTPITKSFIEVVSPNSVEKQDGREHVADNDTVLPKAANEGVMSSGMDQVIERGPRLIRNTPLILTNWTPNVSLKPGVVTKVPVWVKLYNVPVVAYSEDGLSLIATQIGKPIMLDAFTSSMCVDSWGRISFARALIEIDVNSDLKKEVKMAIPVDEDDRSGYISEVIVTDDNVDNMAQNNDGFTEAVSRKNKGKKANDKQDKKKPADVKASSSHACGDKSTEEAVVECEKDNLWSKFKAAKEASKSNPRSTSDFEEEFDDDEVYFPNEEYASGMGGGFSLEEDDFDCYDGYEAQVFDMSGYDIQMLLNNSCLVLIMLLVVQISASCAISRAMIPVNDSSKEPSFGINTVLKSIDNDPSFPVVQNYVSNTWSKFGFEKITRNDNGVYLFKFASKAGLEQVLESGPWMIRKSLIILNKWCSSVSLKKGEVTKVLVWVKLYNVPVLAYSDDGLNLIATQVGKPVMLDAFTSSMCVESWGRISFARALIEISSASTLKKEVIMAIP